MGNIRLLDDGRYEQTFRLAGDSAQITNSGKWELNRDDYKVYNFNFTEYSVYLYDSLIVDSFGNLRSNYREPALGLRGLEVGRSAGAIYLSINPDLPFYFWKQ